MFSNVFRVDEQNVQREIYSNDNPRKSERGELIRILYRH